MAKRNNLPSTLPDHELHVTPTKYKANGPQELDMDCVKANLSSQFSAENNSGANDAITELLGSLNEVKLRLHKVEAWNIRLKRDRLDLIKQVENQKAEMLALRKENENLRKDKMDFKKMQEQVSNSFQENCRLKEQMAVVNKDNSHLKQNVLDLKTENSRLSKKITQLLFNQRDHGGEHNAANHEFKCKDTSEVIIRPTSSFHISKANDKHRSAPQFSANKKTLEELSEKLFSQFVQDKNELVQQYSQMLDIQKDGNLPSNVSTEFSFLGFEVAEADDLKSINSCLEQMLELKQNLVFINYSLKYVLHFFLSRNKQESFQPNYKNVANPSNNLQQLLDHVTNGIGADSLECSAGNFADKSSSAQNYARAEPAHKNLQLKLSEELENSPFKKPLHSSCKSNLTRLDKNPLSEPVNSKHVSNVNHLPVLSRQSDNPLNSELNDLGSNIVADGLQLSPTFVRSDSAECNAGSPPQSDFLLSSDSLYVNNLDALTAVDCPETPLNTGANHSPTEKDDERICPMCQVVFPKFVPQKEFETHVIGHFDVEEFELI